MLNVTQLSEMFKATHVKQLGQGQLNKPLLNEDCSVNKSECAL